MCSEYIGTLIAILDIHVPLLLNVMASLTHTHTHTHTVHSAPFTLIVASSSDMSCSNLTGQHLLAYFTKSIAKLAP